MNFSKDKLNLFDMILYLLKLINYYYYLKIFIHAKKKLWLKASVTIFFN